MTVFFRMKPIICQENLYVTMFHPFLTAPSRMLKFITKLKPFKVSEHITNSSYNNK